ncbi:MAG: hypothetical protein HOH74_04590 [Gemmatimonadetes bacterium]|nr:hypothetical protein [Gemmatimonadota bacterium]
MRVGRAIITALGTGILVMGILVATGCAHRYYADDLKPLGEGEQGEHRTVLDDGSVVLEKDRLEITVRPMSVDELNRQFNANTQVGTNPYTWGRSTVFRTDETPERFTVFRVSVKNYEFPKVHLTPTDAYITSSNGRKYYALSYHQLWTYYRSYATGGKGGDTGDTGAERQGARRGNELNEWSARSDLLKRTMYPDDLVFSGQEQEGFLVFRPLDTDVSTITIHIPDVAIRFDYRGEPVEVIDVTAQFDREIGKVYPDGTREPM